MKNAAVDNGNSDHKNSDGDDDEDDDVADGSKGSSNGPRKPKTRRAPQLQLKDAVGYHVCEECVCIAWV